MGRSLLIVLLGFATSFGILAQGQSRRMIASVDRVVSRYESYSTKNSSSSGAYIALNKLFLNPTVTYSSAGKVGSDSLIVTVAALGTDKSMITSIAKNDDQADTAEVVIYRGTQFKSAANGMSFAIWTKGSITNVTAKDSVGNDDDSLVMQNAPFMPEIDYDALATSATAQSHSYNGNFSPGNTYPNGSFYYASSIPNVTYVKGDLVVNSGHEIYGIYVVEGNVELHSDAFVRGVICLPNPGSQIEHAGIFDNAAIRGGVVLRGDIDGGTQGITVRYWPTYLRPFVNTYANVSSNSMPMRVIAWN